MDVERNTRLLVVLERSAATAELIDAIRDRVERGPTQVRVVVPNPAAGELHLLHPERHDKAAEAEIALRKVMPALELAAGGPVIGSVSVRHDPMDAIEDVLFSEPVDEILLVVTTHKMARALHQDLPHRLHHYGLPITSLGDSELNR